LTTTAIGAQIPRGHSKFCTSNSDMSTEPKDRSQKAKRHRPICIVMALVVVGAVVATVADVAADLVIGLPIGSSVMDFDHPK
jgi:hypothetical protein